MPLHPMLLHFTLLCKMLLHVKLWHITLLHLTLPCFTLLHLKPLHFKLSQLKPSPLLQRGQTSPACVWSLPRLGCRCKGSHCRSLAGCRQPVLPAGACCLPAHGFF